MSRSWSGISVKANSETTTQHKSSNFSASENLEVIVMRAEEIKWLNSSGVVISISFVPKCRRIFLAFGISVFFRTSDNF